MAEPPTTGPSQAAAPERDALLATKLHVPRPRAGFLSRPRLRERLTQAAALELTLVCAPAGFGRTRADEVTLVLDDYHLIQAPTVHGSLAMLLERLLGATDRTQAVSRARELGLLR